MHFNTKVLLFALSHSGVYICIHSSKNSGSSCDRGVSTCLKHFDLVESPPVLRISVVKAQSWAQCRNFLQDFTHAGIQGTLEIVMQLVEVHSRWAMGNSCSFPNLVSSCPGLCRIPLWRNQPINNGMMFLQSFSVSLQPQRCFHHALCGTALLIQHQGTWVMYSCKLSPKYDCNLFLLKSAEIITIVWRFFVSSENK